MNISKNTMRKLKGVRFSELKIRAYKLELYSCLPSTVPLNMSYSICKRLIDFASVSSSMK